MGLEIMSIKRPVLKDEQLESPEIAGAFREAKHEKVKRQERDAYIAETMINQLGALCDAPSTCWNRESLELLRHLASQLPTIEKKIQRYESMNSGEKMAG